MANLYKQILYTQDDTIRTEENVRRCKFFHHVYQIWSYSFDHLESVMLTFLNTSDLNHVFA